jgi:hypothetical protein
MPLHRLFGNILLSILSKPASGYWHLFDAQNGFTAISRTALQRLPLERLEVGYEFENRLLIELNISNTSAADVPFPARYGEEQSGMRIWRVGPAILWTLLTGFWRRARSKYLSNGLSLSGAALAGASALLAIASLTGAWAWFSASRSAGAWVALSFAGGIVLLCAFFTMDNAASRRLRLRQTKPAHSIRMGTHA